MSKRIYFCYSKQERLSHIEKCLPYIERAFPGATIIDSGSLDWEALVAEWKSHERAYLEVVNQYDETVVLEHGGFLGRGLYSQVNYTLEIQHPCWVLRDVATTPTLFVVKAVHVHDPNNWKYYYGMLELGSERQIGDSNG